MGEIVKQLVEAHKPIEDLQILLKGVYNTCRVESTQLTAGGAYNALSKALEHIDVLSKCLERDIRLGFWEK